MPLYSQYQIKQELDAMAPALGVVLVAMALEKAVTELDFEPLADLTGNLLGSLFE